MLNLAKSKMLCWKETTAQSSAWYLAYARGANHVESNMKLTSMRALPPLMPSAKVLESSDIAVPWISSHVAEALTAKCLWIACFPAYMEYKTLRIVFRYSIWKLYRADKVVDFVMVMVLRCQGPPAGQNFS